MLHLLTPRAGVLLLTLFAASTAHGQEAGKIEPLGHFPKAEVTIVSGSHSHDFHAWVADTEPRRAQGLMFVRKLEPRQGMLFLFDSAQVVYFWMKNTLIPLDMLFIAPDGRITNIIERATPLSTEPLPSAEPVTGVLEFAGGTAARLGIHAGDRVVHPAFNVLRTG